MKNLIRALLGLALVASAMPATASDSVPASVQAAITVETVVAGVKTKYAKVTTIKANFVQTTKSAVFGDDEQKGSVVLKRPSKMRWEFLEDGKQFVTDGETMWIYTKADNQVIRYDDISDSRTALDAMLSSLDKLDELFEVSLVEADKDHYVLDLTPSDTEQVKKVRLTLTADYTLKQFVITDPFDSVTVLDFRDVVLGVEVADAVFVFVPPEGAEVIEAGQF